MKSDFYSANSGRRLQGLLATVSELDPSGKMLAFAKVTDIAPLGNITRRSMRRATQPTDDDLRYATPLAPLLRC